MNKSKWKNKQSIHEEDKRTSQRLTIVAKYSEGEDGDRIKNKWKKLKKEKEWKNNQSVNMFQETWLRSTPEGKESSPQCSPPVSFRC